MARPTQNKKYLYEKYHELAWALETQGYSLSDIGVIMNRDKSVIKRVVDRRPKGWSPKWVKAAGE